MRGAHVNAITNTFNNLLKANRTALMPYLTIGYPEKDSALSIVPSIVKAGADLIELGVPFSDPLADGATIQAASQRALENGISLKQCLEQAGELRSKGIKIPFVLMGYYNPIYQFGIRDFADSAAIVGIDGVIVPDLPPGEAEQLVETLSQKDICTIFLLAPTSDIERVRTVAELSRGFVYLVSLVGVTGMRDELSPDLAGFVNRVRQQTSKPLAVGFGISTPQQAAQVSRIADGVIVGSALIKTIRTGEDPADAAYTFINRLRSGIDKSAVD
jgi:tryptophan synthase alpha chain